MATIDADTSLDELKHIIRTCPVIDNHAHNLLRPSEQKSGDLLTCTSEAAGHALEDTPTSLAHLRAARQLRKLYDLPAAADWAAILKKRGQLLDEDANALTKKCLEGTQTILIDDGLGDGDTMEPYGWHDKFTASPCKRIVRIETVASDILSALYQQDKLPVGAAIADEEACSLAWVTFITAFEQAIAAAVEEDDIVGFKSVICYRTGLDVHLGRDLEVTEDGLRSFRRHFLPECVARKFRVEAKGMNDALVISTCKLIAAGYRQRDIAKPFQFHTGLGDNDINLLDSDPGCLQPIIQEFPLVPFVLLHSSYPYTRNAGYLSTVYKNCYLDIGEVFPMVSRGGQENILRQALELTPYSKLLWSTDGHYFPETYYLANVQGRQVMETVLMELVNAEDLTASQAVHAIQAIFFDNSNRLYSLHLKLDTNTKSLPERPKDAQAKVEATMASNVAKQDVDQLMVNRPSRYNADVYNRLLKKHPNTRFIFFQWLDYLGQMRSRCLPIVEFTKLLNCDETISISYGNLGTTQVDQMSSAANPVGSVQVMPILSSLRPMQHLGQIKDAATVMCTFLDAKTDEPLDLCPRSALGRFVGSLEDSYDVKFLVGFEIEVTFCKRMEDPGDPFKPLDTNHAWGTFSDEQYMTGMPLVLEITTALQNIGIYVQQIHSEAGNGQYEFVLPPLSPLHAVDTLIQARQCICQIAATHQLRATYHPQPFPGIGTAAHAHISFNSNSNSTPVVVLEKLEMLFMASILKHMPALCAFTMPQPVSYRRVIDDSWTGGTWISWGTQNREVPLRRVGPLRWELRFLDGCANMYLALAAVFGAGLHGVRNGTQMTQKDCLRNPSQLSSAEKQEIGITTKLPTSLDQAVKAAEEDTKLQQALAPTMMHYLAMKHAEQEMLNAMSEKDRRIWLIDHY